MWDAAGQPETAPTAPATPAAPAAPAAPADPAAAAAVPADGAVDYASIAAPEGHTFTDAELGGLRDFAGELGLSGEQAQTFIARESAIEQRAAEFAETERAERVAGWEAELWRDPDVGGDNMGRSVRAARQFITSHFGAEFADKLHASGALYNPSVFKPFAKLGGESVEPTGAARATPTPAAPAKPMTDREQWKLHYGDTPYPNDL